MSLVDADGHVSPWPVVYGYRFARDAAQRRAYLPDRASRCSLRLFAPGEPYRLLGLFATRVHLFGAGDAGGSEPPRVHLLGTDYRGRDIFSRLVHGARISLTIGVLGVVVAFTVGMIVGGVSGFAGGAVDGAIQRLCEVLMMLPGFYVLLAIRGALPDTTRWSSTQLYCTVVLLVSSLYWASLARAIRGQVLSLREREFVTAARALGVTPWRIITRHLLPNTVSYAVVAATISIPGYILMESGLSMLGLGIQEPEASWGNMLADAMHIAEIAEHPWVLAPGVLICVAITAFNVMGDGLRDAFDPRG
ncbi:MAG: ABC transporter permease [Planctomycetota bacterium]